MAKIYMIGSFKGGVGKSVSTINLAYSLAEMGKKVLAVDFDSQANLTTCFGVEDVTAVPVTIGDLMMAQIYEEPMPELSEYIMSRNGVVNNKLQVAGILLTMCDTRTNLCKVITEEVAEVFRGQIRIFKSMVPSTVKVGESVYYSEPLIEYAPENKACEAYRNLAKELMNDEG